MSKFQDYHTRLHVEQLFTATGQIGADSYDALMAKNLRVAVEGVGATNTVLIKGRLKGQAAWATLATITDVSAGTTVDISLVDEVQFSCGVYSASGTPKVIASGFTN